MCVNFHNFYYQIKSSDLQSKDFKNTIDKLGEEVLTSSMSKINNFLLNENI